MSKTKIAIMIDKSILARLDRLVAEQVFANRSQAIVTS
jgi:metal-responsive CopG/Arc/MetJ family transcriptional regulator